MSLITLPLLKKLITPKRAVIVVAIVAIFSAGWTVNGWRYKGQIARKEAQLLSAYEKQRSAYLQEFQTQQIRDQQAAEELTADLAQLRQQRKALELKLRSAAVVKSHDEICGNGGSGNPFGDDFARLWNAWPAE